jgi:ABC-type amino acid transport substrate-binding protein
MIRFLTNLIAIVFAVTLTIFAVTSLQSHEVKSAVKETTLERVKRTKTLTCAYWPWPELMEKNPNTGAMSGVIVDVVEKVAENLGATVKWQEEATIDNFVQLVDSGRVDAICAPLYPPPFMRNVAHFAVPLFYTSFDVYVRPQDKRFDDARDAINKPDVKVLSLDGSAAGYFAGKLFPSAHHNSLPGMLGAGQVLKDVADGKADVTVSEQLTAARFLDHNQESLRMVRWQGQPLVTLGMTPFVTKLDDVVWADTLNGILNDLLDFGVVDKIMADHHMVAGWHYRPLASRYEK